MITTQDQMYFFMAGSGALILLLVATFMFREWQREMAAYRRLANAKPGSSEEYSLGMFLVVAAPMAFGAIVGGIAICIAVMIDKA